MNIQLMFGEADISRRGGNLVMNYIDIVGYGVCTGGAEKLEEATENLKVQVLARIKEGWEPLGGITHVVVEFPYSRQHIFSQAIVKYETPT